MSGLGTQVAGTHYTSMKMQPVELAYKLYATPCFCKLAKYLTRNKGDKLENLKKALHCIRLEQDLNVFSKEYFDQLDFVDVEDGKALIHQFTDNNEYQIALFHMWLQNHQSAILTVESIIKEYEDDLK